MSIEYSDGVQIESHILQLVKSADALDSDTAIGCERYSEWAVRYHLCPDRANLFRHLDFSGLDVLELGAGMGAVSRFLCESAKSLTVVEGTEQRFAVLSSRLRDRENWSGIVSNIQDVTLDKRFDVVCLIGVLEYAELYIDPTDSSELSPFRSLMEKAVSFLKPDGVFILALENQLGLKYWSGAAEDHTGRQFDSICGYAPGKTPKTFPKKRVLELMESSGLSHVDEYYPFPDYKIAHAVLSRDFVENFPELSADLAVTHPYENYGRLRKRYFPDILAAKTVAKAGLISEFANSFLFIGSSSEDSSTRIKLLRRQIKEQEMAWYYSSQRRFPTSTVFLADVASKSLTVSKLPRGSSFNGEREFIGEKGVFYWHPCERDPLVEGELLPHLLFRYAYFEMWEAFVDTLERFISWSFQKWAINTSDNASGAEISGKALDAVFLNAVIDTGEGRAGFSLFDLEWSAKGSIPMSWFIMRNAFGLTRHPELFVDSCPFLSLYHLYLSLCDRLSVAPDFDSDLGREAEFQMIANRESSLELVQGHLKHLLQKPIDGGSFPRVPPTRIKADSLASRKRKMVRKIRCSLLPLGLQLKKIAGFLSKRP